MRSLTKLLPVLLLAAPAAADDRSPIGRKIDDFSLTDVRTGRAVSPSDFPDRKAVAVVFLGTACPINNQYLPRLNRLHRDYADQGLLLLGLNANVDDTAEGIAGHAREHEIAFPVLRDAGGKVAARLGATMTPEAFVLDAQGVVRYRGRIDNQFGYLHKRLDPTEETFKEAIEAVLAGRRVEVAETEVAGCHITRRPEPKPGATVTFARHVAPLLQRHCQECHREGQIGPMSLIDYQDVADWSESIRSTVADGRMPPWFADPSVGEFANDRHLPEEARRVLLAWIEQGCPEGDPADLPPAKEWATDEEWMIGKPDLVIEMPLEFEVPAETPRRGLPYQYFVVDPGFEEEMWVRKAEAKPGAAAVVHHIIAFVVPPASQIDPEYPNFPLLPGVRNARVLCGTAPGDLPSIHPEGTAARIPPGSKIVFQMHYTPNGQAATDRSKIGLVFSEKPHREIITVPVFNSKIKIPPGDPSHRIESWFTFKHDATILAMMPHMHLRGKDFRYEVVRPDGRVDPLLNVPRYNFNWQTAYRLKEPYKAPKGSRMHCVAHYDNSADNPSNPDPESWVYWGDQTWQEMMIGWMDMVYDRDVGPIGR